MFTIAFRVIDFPYDPPLFLGLVGKKAGFTDCAIDIWHCPTRTGAGWRALKPDVERLLRKHGEGLVTKVVTLRWALRWCKTAREIWGAPVKGESAYERATRVTDCRAEDAARENLLAKIQRMKGRR